jgi:hypothetical protein
MKLPNRLAANISSYAPYSLEAALGWLHLINGFSTTGTRGGTLGGSECGWYP